MSGVAVAKYIGEHKCLESKNCTSDHEPALAYQPGGLLHFNKNNNYNYYNYNKHICKAP